MSALQAWDPLNERYVDVIVDADGSLKTTVAGGGGALESTQQQILIAVEDYAITEIVYDSNNNPTSMTRLLNGVSQTKTLAWDASGNLLSTTAWV